MLLDVFFLVIHLQGGEDIAFSNGNPSQLEKPQTSGAGIGCKGEGTVLGQVEDVTMRSVFACETCRGRKAVCCSRR